MRNASIAAGVLILAATVVICLVIPANQVISVGDDASTIRAIELFGYPKSLFSLARRRLADGKPLTPVAFCMDDGWHLLVWHNERVQFLTHFQYVPRKHSYGDWIHTRDVESFTIPRPNLLFYFIGLVVLLGIGWATRRLKLIRRIVLGVLLFLVVLGNLVVGCFAESLALFPICVSLGWVAAFLLGANIFRSAGVEEIGMPQTETTEQNSPINKSGVMERQRPA